MVSTQNSALTRDLLLWVEAEPRSYSQTMEAWRTHCPRLSVWEDALLDGLVQVRASSVTVTPRGRAVLSAAPPS